MPSPTWTRIVIALAALLWFGIAYAIDAPIDAKWLKPAGFVMSGVVLALLAFDLLLWRFLPLWLTRRPNIRGTWKAELQYRWPEEEPPKVKDCYLAIHQTFSTVSVQMYFDISSSESRSADIRSNDKRRSLWWSYLSMAYEFDTANPPHRGAAELVISTVPKTILQGTYWTERKTKGSIMTSGRSKKIYEDYQQACRGDYEPLP